MKYFVMVVLSLCAFSAFSSPININTADAKAISDALSGIGPKKAEAIIKYRTEKHPFKTLEDLLEVPGIGEKTIEINKNDILLNDANSPSQKTSKN